MLFVEKANILSNRQINGRCYKMILECPSVAQQAKPGQFIEIECGKNNFPLLKRPISIHNVYDNVTEIIYFKVGVGTDLLSEKEPGDIIEIVGPLGNGFDIKETENHILAGGGYGVPPLYFLAKKIAEKNDPKKIFVCVGAKNKDLLLCLNDFMALGVSLCIATDDGSMGIKGYVTDSVRMILENNKKDTAVYSCGPKIMMKNLFLLTEKYDFVCETECSMENVMACGVGVCNGCVIKTRNGSGEIYRRVCKDGPVFKGAEIVW